MAIGADIPPEIIQHILNDVCEGAWLVLDVGMDSDVCNQKEDIKNITACSLTCVYWAQICRVALFHRVWIKNYEDMRAFSSLVSSASQRLQPISTHVLFATLEQRVGDRPWFHLLRMQPSLSLFRSDVLLNIKINIKDSDPDSIDEDVTVQRQWPTSRRLFVGLPRTLPAWFFQGGVLNIDNARFVTPHDLTSLLSRLIHPSTNSPRDLSVVLRNITWHAHTRFESNLLTSHPLELPENNHFDVTVQSSQYIAQAAWLAFVTRFRRISYRSEKSVRQILSPAQRTILGVCTLLSRATTVLRLYLTYFSVEEPASEHVILFKDRVVDVKEICIVHVEEGGPDSAYHSLSLGFFHAGFVGYSGPILTVEHISILCIHVTVHNFVPTEMSSASGESPTDRMQNVITYPWEDIAGISAEHEGFMRLQLSFPSHDDVDQFMQARRLALFKLDGRVSLFYQGDDGPLAADSETLDDLPGDARTEHGYIDGY